MTQEEKPSVTDRDQSYEYLMLTQSPLRNERGCPVVMQSERTHKRRQHLSRIVFPDAIEQDGLSLVSLLAMPCAELVGIIPAYKGQAKDDHIVLLARPRGMRQTIRIGVLSPGVSDMPLTVRFGRDVFESFRENGRVEIFYEVWDADGASKGRAPVTTVHMLIKDAPAVMPAPGVRLGWTKISQTDISPELIVTIPATTPPCVTGDRIRLRVGDVFSGEVTLLRTDVTQDPMVQLLVSYEDLMDILRDRGSCTFPLEVAYDVEREGILSVSDPANVMFDFLESEEDFPDSGVPS
ncbi:hypothetical protein KPL74_06815 [Bacillus sp. NP157]|nr:hypothetical protein KPL74_06815 [Bacillus sp. NP157]